MSLRAFHEGEDKVFRVSPVKVLDGNLKFLVDVAEDDARRAAQDPKRIVFCPPLCTFRERKGAGEADLVEGLTLSVEVDQNPEAARAKLEPLLGPATVAVRSGGIWQSNGTAYDKMHLHWRLAEPAQGKEQLAKLKRAREIAAHLVGADPTTVPICHPMRWAGSWHRKAEPRPCEIIPSASNFDHEIDLDEALAKLEPFAPAPAPSSGNGAAPPQPGGDWDVLVANILRGEGLHKSITRLAMKLLASGMSEPAAVNHLRALMVQSQAPRDERWQKRFEYIPRAVRSAAKKLAKSEEPAPEQPKQPTPDPPPLAEVHAIFRKWLGDDYDIDTHRRRARRRRRRAADRRPALAAGDLRTGQRQDRDRAGARRAPARTSPAPSPRKARCSRPRRGANATRTRPAACCARSATAACSSSRM